MEAVYDPATGLHRCGDLGMSVAMSDELLAMSYLRFRAEGSLESIYYEKVPTLTEFLQACAKPTCACLGGFVDNNLAGVCWAFNYQEMGHLNKAELGFGFFDAVATSRQKVELGRLAIDVIFTNFRVDVLTGITPEPNRAARRFTRACGFEMQSEPVKNAIVWEGALASAYHSSLTRADWLARQKPQRLGLDVRDFKTAEEAA